MVLLFASLAIFRADAINTREYHLFFAVFNLIWMTSVYLTQLYMSKNWLDFELFFKRTFKCYVLTTVALLLFSFLFTIISFPVFLSFFVLPDLLPYILFNRIVFNLLVISLRSKFKMAKNVVVLGYNEVSITLIDYFQKEAKLVKLAGCFDDKGEIQKAAGFAGF